MPQAGIGATKALRILARGAAWSCAIGVGAWTGGDAGMSTLIDLGGKRGNGRAVFGVDRIGRRAVGAVDRSGSGWIPPIGTGMASGGGKWRIQ